MAGHYENTGKCLTSIGFLCSMPSQPVLTAKYSSLLYCLLVVLMICFLARRVSLHVFLPGGVACYYKRGRNGSSRFSFASTIRQSLFEIVVVSRTVISAYGYSIMVNLLPFIYFGLAFNIFSAHGFELQHTVCLVSRL